MTKKTFLITAKAYRDFTVEAESSEEALEIASAEYHGGFDWEIEEWDVEDELKTDHDIATAKQNGAVDIFDA